MSGDRTGDLSLSWTLYKHRLAPFSQFIGYVQWFCEDTTWKNCYKNSRGCIECPHCNTSDVTKLKSIWNLHRDRNKQFHPIVTLSFFILRNLNSTAAVVKIDPISISYGIRKAR